jgi:type VI protein secretion system component VasK
MAGEHDLGGLKPQLEEALADSSTLKKLKPQLEQVIANSNALREAVQKESRAARRGRIFVALAMGAFLAVLVVTLGIGYQNRQIINRLEECTTAGENHDCYNQGQQRTAAVIQQLIQGQLVIAVCAAQFDTAAEIQACANAKLGAPR